MYIHLDRKGVENINRNAREKSIAIPEENKNRSVEQELKNYVLLPSKAPLDLTLALQFHEEKRIKEKG